MSDRRGDVTTFPAAVPASRAAGRRAELPAIDMWSPKTQPVLAIALLRIFAAAVISEHLAWRALTEPAAVAQDRGLLGGMHSALTFCASLHGVERALHVDKPTLWLWVGAALGIAICVGIASRACSALLLFVWAGSRCASPVLLLDDSVIPMLAFWTMLLPPDGALRLLGSATWRSWARQSVDGWVPFTYTTYLGVAFLALTLADERARQARIWLFVAIACVIALGSPWRALAALPAAAALSRLGAMGGAELACVAAAGVWAISLAFSVWPERSPVGAVPRSTMNVFGAVGVAATCLLAIRVAAGAAGILPVAQATSRLLLIAELGFPVDISPADHARGREPPVESPAGRPREMRGP
jgi:hypothetical protein